MKNVFIQFNDVYLNETSVVSEEDEAKNFGQYFDYVYKKGTLEENNEENELKILKTCLALLFKKSNMFFLNLIISLIVGFILLQSIFKNVAETLPV